MALQDNDQFRMALDLVKTVMQSGMIKLYGVGNNTAFAEKNGKADAKYLLTLLTDLQAGLPQE